MLVLEFHLASWEPTWALASGPLDTSVGALFVVAGVGVGTGTVAVGVGVDVGAGVGSDVTSGAGVLAGNGVVAAPGPGVAVETACGVSDGSGAGITGLGADVAASAGAGTVATAAPGAGVCSPQASRAAKINRTIHRGQLQHPRSPFVALFLVALFVFFKLRVGLTQSPLHGSLLWMAAGLISVGNLWWMVRGSNRA